MDAFALYGLIFLPLPQVAGVWLNDTAAQLVAAATLGARTGSGRADGQPDGRREARAQRGRLLTARYAAGMVLEVALIDVRPGQEDDFTNAYRIAREVLATTPGCRSVRMTRGVESPSRFVLLVEWDSVDAHETNFRATERFTTWRGHISRFFAGPPTVEHFTDVDADPTGRS